MFFESSKVHLMLLEPSFDLFKKSLNSAEPLWCPFKIWDLFKLFGGDRFDVALFIILLCLKLCRFKNIFDHMLNFYTQTLKAHILH